MKRIAHILFPALVFFLCPGWYSAQIRGSLLEKSLLARNRFTITQFSTKEGLPQNQVREIISKPDGTLLLTTTNGIVAFNGYEFKLITNNQDVLRLDFYKLHWFEKYNTLAGLTTDGQFYSIAPNFALLNPAGKYNERIRNGSVSGDSVCLVSQSGRVFYGAMPQLQMRELAATGVKNAECVLLRRPYVYLGSREGLYRTHLGTGVTEKLADGIFIRLEENPHSKELYAVAISRLYRLSGSRLEMLLHIDPSSEEDFCENLAFAGRGSLFLASRKGLYWINGSEVSHYTIADGLPSNHISAVLYSPRENCVFAGTEEKGFLKLQFKNAISYSSNEGYDISSLGSTIKASDGKIVSVETCCNIYEFKGDHGEIYTDVKSSFACLAEIDGYICAGTWGSGIELIRNGKKAGRIEGAGLPDNSVRALFKDSKGYVWAGTSNGIARGRSLFTLQPFLTGQVRDRVVCFYERRDGSICLGGVNGVAVIKNDKLLTVINRGQELNGREVRGFYEDSLGRLWFGSYGNGLYCYEQGQLTALNDMPGCMLNKDIFCLARDAFGYLNMTSNHGLWRVAEKDLFDFYKGRIHRLVPFRLDEEAGILNTEFNGGFQNNYLAADSNIYFPSIEGLVRFKPYRPVPRRLSPVIDYLYLNDTLSLTGTHGFERSTSSIRFDFSCASYASMYNTYFQHKLVGKNQYEWSVPQKAGSVYLKLLPPGTYTFIVRAIDAFNDRKPTETRFEFEIKPYFYETLWFKVSCVLAFIALSYLIGRWRVRRHRRRTEQREQYSRKLAEMELRAIQAQLNPHFLFNCMNTIKHFILERNFNRANESLNKLSVLLRNSLESSDKLFIALGEKIKFLRNYIELEKMRLGDQLDYSITCNDDVDPQTTVPHLIIQPYIENAIKHGINHLESGKGRLEVVFRQEGGNLVCTIRDNGIGREASALLNSNRFYRSKGTQLTQEKAAFLKVYNNYNCDIIIDDIYDADHRPAGTLVTIKMPLNNDHRNN